MKAVRPNFAAGGAHTSLSLFEQNSSLPGSLNDDSMVRGVITASIKSCGISRQQIAERMSISLNYSVTERMLTAFTSESKELHRWPAAWDRAFCEAVGDSTLLRCRAEAAGFRVIDRDEIAILAIGREYLRQKRATEKLAALERQVQGVDEL